MEDCREVKRLNLLSREDFFISVVLNFILLILFLRVLGFVRVGLYIMYVFLLSSDIFIFFIFGLFFMVDLIDLI